MSHTFPTPDQVAAARAAATDKAAGEYRALIRAKMGAGLPPYTVPMPKIFDYKARMEVVRLVQEEMAAAGWQSHIDSDRQQDYLVIRPGTQVTSR